MKIVNKKTAEIFRCLIAYFILHLFFHYTYCTEHAN